MIADFVMRGNLHNGPVAKAESSEEQRQMSVHHFRGGITALLFSVLSAACTTAGSGSQAPSTPLSGAPSVGAIASESSLPTPAPSGFGFSVEAVIGYYETQGFDCDEIQPSATAAGYFFQGCQMTDADGRTLAIGFVTDPSGDLADGYASVQGSADEPILEPAASLDHLSGFLGAMLGEERGTSLLEWLAGHLGDSYAETTIDVLLVATYTQSATDHSRLYLEIARRDYVDAPAPSGSGRGPVRPFA